MAFMSSIEQNIEQRTTDPSSPSGRAEMKDVSGWSGSNAQYMRCMEENGAVKSPG